MTGCVHTINRRKGLVAIKADVGTTFTIVETTGSERNCRLIHDSAIRGLNARKDPKGPAVEL